MSIYPNPTLEAMPSEIRDNHFARELTQAIQAHAKDATGNDTEDLVAEADIRPDREKRPGMMTL